MSELLDEYYDYLIEHKPECAKISLVYSTMYREFYRILILELKNKIQELPQDESIYEVAIELFNSYTKFKNIVVLSYSIKDLNINEETPRLSTKIMSVNIHNTKLGNNIATSKTYSKNELEHYVFGEFIFIKELLIKIINEMLEFTNGKVFRVVASAKNFETIKNDT